MPRAAAKPGARRRPVNVTLRADVLAAARRRNINISEVAEQALIAALRQAEAAAWLAENAEAIEAHNERIDRAGPFNAGLRRF
jgi:antitoxin CcdA